MRHEAAYSNDHFIKVPNKAHSAVSALAPVHLHQLPVPCAQGHVGHTLLDACVEIKAMLSKECKGGRITQEPTAAGRKASGQSVRCVAFDQPLLQHGVCGCATGICILTVMKLLNGAGALLHCC
jgi:hypothetical protein